MKKVNAKGSMHSVPKKIRLAILLLFGFTAFPAISNDSIISGSEQFNAEATVTGNSWANFYRPTDNSLQILPYSIIDGMAIHEGDIVLGKATDLQSGYIPADSNIQQAVATSYLGHRWIDGKVPYVIHASYSAVDANKILAGIDHIASNTSISFVPRTSEADYIEIFPGAGCSSGIGRTGGKQVVSIAAPGCTGLGTVVHELYHALGIYHEHSRSDRDSYVIINFGNIQSGREHNFYKAINSDNIGTYDYGSIMHYGRRAFTKNGLDTITAPANVTIGNRYALSAGDIAAMQYLYYTDLQLELASVNEAVPGSAVQAAITIINQGDNTIGNIIANAVKVSLPIPNQSTYTGFSSSDNWVCQQVAQNVECAIDVLDRSSNSTINIDLTAPASLSSMQLNPTVSASNRDIQPANNNISRSIVIRNPDDMLASMSLSAATLNVADTLVTTLNLSNPSQTDLQQISVAITSVDAITYNSFNGSGWNCDNISSTTICTLATLAKSDSTQFSLIYTANAAVGAANISSVVNTQNANGDLIDITTSATFSIKVPTPPSTSPSGSTTPQPAKAGGGAFGWLTSFFILLLLPLVVSTNQNKRHK